MLNVAGLLDTRMYGPGTLDESMRRRSIYFTVKRSKLIPTMMLFDWPEHLVSIGKTPGDNDRSSSFADDEQQADSRVCRWLCQADVEARHGQRRSKSHVISTTAISLGYESAYGREPVEQETQLANAFLRKQLSLYQDMDAKAAEHAALTDFAQVLLSGNEFLFIQ